jgi:hypothetical protein
MDKFARRQFPIAREMLRAAHRTPRLLAEDLCDLDEAEAALRAIEEEFSEGKPQQQTKRFLPH